MVETMPVLAGAAPLRCQRLEPGGPIGHTRGQNRSPKLWWEAHHLALPVCTLAGGPPVARHLAATSRALHHAVCEAWGDLVRRFPCRLYVVGGIDDEYRTVDTVERFDPLTGVWEVLPPMGTPRAGAAAAAVAGRLYVLGGEVAGRALHDAQRFDPWMGVWESLPDMQSGRIRAAAVVLGGCLYLLGGLDGSKPLRSTEQYDPQGRIWQGLPPMQRPRYACAASVQDGRICAFGGELTDAGMLASMEIFDPQASEWELMPAVRAPCCGAAMVVADGAAFTLGGLSLSGQALPLVERLPLHSFFDRTSTMMSEELPVWTQKTPMHIPRHLASSAPFGGGIVVVGGKGSTFDATKDVELYIPETGTWTALPPLPSPRLRAAVAGHSAGRLPAVPGIGIGSCTW